MVTYVTCFKRRGMICDQVSKADLKMFSLNACARSRHQLNSHGIQVWILVSRMSRSQASNKQSDLQEFHGPTPSTAPTYKNLTSTETVCRRVDCSVRLLTVGSLVSSALQGRTPGTFNSAAAPGLGGSAAWPVDLESAGFWPSIVSVKARHTSTLPPKTQCSFGISLEPRCKMSRHRSYQQHLRKSAWKLSRQGRSSGKVFSVGPRCLQAKSPCCNPKSYLSFHMFPWRLARSAPSHCINKHAFCHKAIHSFHQRGSQKASVWHLSSSRTVSRCIARAAWLYSDPQIDRHRVNKSLVGIYFSILSIWGSMYSQSDPLSQQSPPLLFRYSPHEPAPRAEQRSEARPCGEFP